MVRKITQVPVLCFDVGLVVHQPYVDYLKLSTSINRAFFYLTCDLEILVRLLGSKM
jgi:hypothetical protein